MKQVYSVIGGILVLAGLLVVIGQAWQQRITDWQKTHAHEGALVSVDYVGTLPDGTIFDSTEGKAPLQMTLGSYETLPDFQKAIDGAVVGETRSVTIPSERAYGSYGQPDPNNPEAYIIPPDTDISFLITLVSIDRTAGGVVPSPAEGEELNDTSVVAE